MAEKKKSESKSKSDSNIKNAIVDMASNLSKVFKKYTKNTREKAWDVITNKDGEKEIKKLLIDPSRPLNIFSKLNFKEWLNHSQS